MKLNMIKCHGSGNDFLLIDEWNGTYSFTEEERAALAKILCDRNSELGADGILYVINSEKSDARMRVFNADGSEASMCGNGLRCVARYVCDCRIFHLNWIKKLLLMKNCLLYQRNLLLLR